MPASRERVDVQEPLARIIGRWALRYGLTEAEKSILDHACTVTAHIQGLADHRKVSFGTIKKQVQALLRKTGDKRLSLVALRLLKEAYSLALLEGQVGVSLRSAIQPKEDT